MGQTEATQARIDDELDSLSFSISKSRRYHEYLWHFYNGWRDRMKIVTAIAGSGLFVIVIANFSGVATWLSAFVALWATLDVVLAPDKKAELHASLCRKFIDLESSILDDPPSEETLRKAKKRRLEIERDEPPCKRIVDLIARNDECRARGYSADEMVPLSANQQRYGRYITFGIKRLDDWSKERQRAREASDAAAASASETIPPASSAA